MSILTKNSIKKMLREEKLQFSPPLDQFQVKNHSIDLRLGFTYLTPKSWRMTKDGREALRLDYLDPDHPEYFDIIELEKGQFFELLPGEYVNVSTLEKIKLPADIMAYLLPRVSVNKKGLSMDLSGMIEAGYEGQLVIPMRNNTQGQIIKLYPGERFCQIIFHQLDNEIKPERSKYHNKDIISGYVGETKIEEVEFIRKGDIAGLKDKYSLEAGEKDE